MAVTTTTASNPLVTTIVVDTDADLTVEAVGSGNKTLYAVEITNPNTADAVYVHVIENTSGTTGTQHNFQFYCPANTSCYYYFPTGIETGTGLMAYASTTSGGGQSATAPEESVTVTFGFTAR